MKSSKNTTVKRCRPLLGTYVAIAVKGINDRLVHQAVERAFQAVERVQRLMSAHNADSDLGRIARQAPYEPLVVDPWTHEVLALGRKLSLLSFGAFDVTVGGRLEKRGFLPPVGGLTKNWNEATYADLDLLPANRVMVRRPCRVDLGGIAKGFAVDKAVEAAFQGPGICAVTVNAGGDVRIQAHHPQEIWLRDPFRPELFWKGGRLREGSFAASGGVAALRDTRHGRAVPLLGQGQSRPPEKTPGILVAASTCVVADALTKVVALAPHPLGAQIVGALGAKAWVAPDERGFYELGFPPPRSASGGAA